MKVEGNTVHVEGEGTGICLGFGVDSVTCVGGLGTYTTVIVAMPDGRTITPAVGLVSFGTFELEAPKVLALPAPEDDFQGGE